jgi:hypothetical protein
MINMMDIDNITTNMKLDLYEDLELEIKNNQYIVNNKRKALDDEKNEMIASILTPEQKEQMEDINSEFERQYEILNNNEELKDNKKELEELKAEIQNETLKAGMTIKGSKKMCVYTPEKVKTIVVVNTEMLKGMTVNIPKLKECWHEETETTPAKVVIR